MQQLRFIGPFNQLYMFRVLITPFLKHLTVFTALWYNTVTWLLTGDSLTVSPFSSNVGVLYQKV
jgi:hypothetical protein